MSCDKTAIYICLEKWILKLVEIVFEYAPINFFIKNKETNSKSSHNIEFFFTKNSQTYFVLKNI